MKFQSEFEKIGTLKFPSQTGIRIQMMPVIMHDMSSIPHFLGIWEAGIKTLFRLSGRVSGTGYLTIDEQHVPAGRSHRRPGLHVDGCGAWSSRGGGWGRAGMLMGSNVSSCVAFNQQFDGEPLTGKHIDEEEGNCEHLRHQCHNAELLEAGSIYWCGPLCVHESLPLTESVDRTFVRLSMPSDSMWPENCTKNPLGVLPGGPIGKPREIGGAYSYH